MKAAKQIIKENFPFAIGVPSLIWQFIFFYLPLALIFFSSFLHLSETGAFEGFTLSHILQFLNPLYLKVIASSLLLALSNSIFCFLIAYPLAYYLAFRAKKSKNLLLFFFIVPFWTNFLLHVYAWFYVLEKEGFVNQILLLLHLIDEPSSLLNSTFAIMIMMVYYYLPFMVLPIYSALERFDIRLIEASYDLGANFVETLKRIIFPLTKRGIQAGFFLVFIPSFGEFIIPELMGGDKKIFVGTVISQYILGEGTGSLGSAFTLVSSLCLLIFVSLFYFLFKKGFAKR
ncbi:MAG: ABC transporter permease [Chlamydiae bacterium]|nr:ABC transporter permease [Chlamydiota bacterium]